MLLVPLFFVLLVWYMIICYKWKKNIFSHIEKIPGDKWLPFVGTTYPMINVPREEVLYKFESIIKKHGPFFRSWNGSTPEIHCIKPEHLQVVMRNSAHTTKGTFYDRLFPWLGEGLFISEGAKWFMQRKLVTPTFHFKVLETFLDTFARRSKILGDKLEALQHVAGTDKYFDILPPVSNCTLSVICEAAMGVPLDQITDDPYAYMKNIYGMTELIMWRYWRPMIKDPIFNLLPQKKEYDTRLRELKEFSRKVINYKRQIQRGQANGSDGKQMSFMDLVMDSIENKNVMNDQDLESLVDTFLFAGYETTANTTSWTLFLLGNNPEAQQRVFEEVRGVLGDKPSPTTMEELGELKYLECAIKETLRLYPVLPMVTRRLKEDVQIDQYKIPAGTQAILHILAVQRDPNNFPDPLKYDPDRFLPENAKDRHPFSYIPFSAGPRNCIGMRFAHLELRAVLATIINRFKVTSMLPPEEVKLFGHIVMRPQHGIHVKFEPRED